jgi:hypothetical protein
MRTPKGFAFLINSALKKRLKSGATNSPLVFVVTSIILPGTNLIIRLSNITTTPINPLMILIFLILSRFLCLFIAPGNISAIMIELTELTPDERLDIDAEKSAAITNPDIPFGNWLAIKCGNKKSASTDTPLLVGRRSG